MRRSHLYFKIVFLSLIFVSPQLKAQFVDLNILSFNDTFSTTGTNKISRTLYDVGIGTLLGKGDTWLWGLSFGSGSFIDESSNNTTTYTVSDFGLKLGLFWTKQKSWFNTITYNFQSTAQYNNGTNAVELRGTSIKADVGYAFWPTESMSLAIKIFYYSSNFKESIETGTLSKVSYTRALIYPGLSFMTAY